MALKQYEEALKDADTCIKMKPDWVKGYVRRGDALERMLLYPEAHEAFTKAVKLDSEDASAKQRLQNLNKLLEELKITEKQLASSANPDQDKFSGMCKWLKDGGGKFPMLYLQYYSEDFRGVHALTKIPNDQMILYVPLSHIMTR